MADYLKAGKGILGALAQARQLADAEKAAVKLGNKILPTAERDANLAKMLEPSAVKGVMYHGSPNPNIAQFKTAKMSKEESHPGNTIDPWSANNRDAVFLTPDPQFSSRYSGDQWDVDMGRSPTTYPVYVQAKNPWDYENPKHIEDAIKGYKEKFPLKKNNGMVSSDESMRHYSFEDILRRLPTRQGNNWSAIENAELQDILKGLGYDSFYVKEAGVKNLGVYDPTKIKSATGNRGTYDLTDPDITKAKGGVLHMADAGRVTKGIVGALTKAAEMTKAEKAALRSEKMGIPNVHFADPLAPPSMPMSEALGIAGAEGKNLNFTEADRSRVHGPNLGGVGFSALQLYSRPHKKANTVWGFGNKTVAEKKVNQNDPENTIWTTYAGSPEQHKSNTVVVKDAIQTLQEANKNNAVDPKQIDLINRRIKEATNDKGNLLFPDSFDITDPQALNAATTFERRAAISDALMGVGVKKPMISKEFKQNNPGVKWSDASNISGILTRETDPALVNANTYDVGPHLFTMDNNIIQRPDLNEAFPYQTTGTDLGLRFKLAPFRSAAPDFINKKGYQPNDLINAWAMSRGAPTQFVDYKYLTDLQKSGNKQGGAIAKPDWHSAVEKHMKDGGYTFVEPKRMGEGGSSDEPKQGAAFGIYPKPKGGKALREAGEDAGDFLNALGKLTKDQGSKEVESLNKPRATMDIANRGILAPTLGLPADLANMALTPLDYLGSKLTGRDIKVSSDKPFLGSEYIKDLMDKYNVTSGEDRPMMETALSLFSPTGMVKGALKTADLAKKAPEAINTVRGGLETVSANAQRPFRPATLTMEAVAPDLGQKGGDKFKDLVTKRMITDEGSPVNMGTLGGQKTEQTPGQGLYENFAGQLETNPMVGITIPRAGNLSTNKRLIADIGTAGQELGQEMVAAHKFTPLLFKNPKDATAMMIGGSEPLTKNQILNISNMLPGMIVTHSPKNNAMFVAPFEGDALDYRKAAQAASEILGKGAKVQFGKADSTKDIMFRGDYKDMGARPPSAESTEMRNRLKKAEERIVRGPSVSQPQRQSQPATLTSTVR